jgi:GINS complex subunit 4
MDIDDLLAEVAVDSTPRETRDLQELTRCWVAERVAPEILPWPSDLMERVLERIRRQVCWQRLALGHEYGGLAAC